MTTLHYYGSQFLRQRLVLSTISGTPIRISHIRSESQTPGLQPHEISLLRLFHRITDGTSLYVDPTGTVLYYQPGILLGTVPASPPLRHACAKNRSITYYLEALLMVAPFCKHALEITLNGVTHNNIDISIDTFRSVNLPIMAVFGISQGLQLHVERRGCCPEGGGEVRFSCPCVETITPFKWLQEGRVKRVRGVAYTARVSPRFAVQVVDKARRVLNDFLPDVWIFTDACKGEKAGACPGYGISLVSETDHGVYKSSDVCVDNASEKPDAVMTEKLLLETDKNNESNIDALQKSMEVLTASEKAEWVGKLAAWKLLAEISLAGVVDSAHQYIPLFFMAVASDHQVSQVKLSHLTPYTIQFIRHIRDFLNITFDFEENLEGFVIAKCVGIGYKNIASKTY